MSDWLYKKINWLAGCLAIAVLFGLIVLVANIEIKDMDLWLHLAAGKYITLNHSVPKVDIFSSTITNTPWINHEWLFQIIVYATHHAAGINGLISLKVWLVFLTFVLLLFYGYKSDMRFGTIIVLLLVLMVYQTRITLRPDLFSLLFLCFTVAILRTQLEKKWSLWALVFIQMIWSNMHGFFIFGPAIVAIDLVSEWARRHMRLPFEWNRSGNLTDGEYKRLKFILPAVILACLVNPHFIKGAAYPLGVLFSMGGESNIFFDHIQELQRPLKWGTLFSVQKYLPYKLLILLSLAGFGLNYKKIDISILILWLLIFLFSISALRNMVFFAIIAYFAYLNNTQDLSFRHWLPVRWQNVKFRTACSLGLSVIFIVWIVDYGNRLLLRGYFDFDNYERKSEYRGVSLRNYPAQAADLLVEHNIQGKFFNDFNSGAYLLGRTFPNIKVFIDGRTEAYGPAFYQKYSKIWKGNTDMFEQAADQYGLTGAFLSYMYVPAPAKTIRYLYERKDWVLIYFDYDASVFLRDVPSNREKIKELRVNLRQRETPQADLLKIGTNKVQPFRYVNRAYALFNMGLPQKAMQEAVEALRIEPYNAKAHKLMGKVHSAQGEFDKAFESFRKAKLLAPNDTDLRYEIALSLFHLGKFSDAKQQCRRVLDQVPDSPDGLWLMSMITANEQNYDEMMALLQKLQRDDTVAGEQFMKIADLLTEQKEFQRAKAVYTMALEIEPDNREIKVMLEMNQAEENNGR